MSREQIARARELLAAAMRNPVARSAAYVGGAVALMVTLGAGPGLVVYYLLVGAGAPPWAGYLTELVTGSLAGAIVGWCAYKGWGLTEDWRHAR